MGRLTIGHVGGEIAAPTKQDNQRQARQKKKWLL